VTTRARRNSATTVLHVIDTLGLGGAERFLVGLVTHLDRRHFAPLVAWVTSGGPFEDDLRAAGIEVIGIGAQGRRDRRALQRLVRLMKEKDVRLLNTHLFVDGFYGRMAAIWAGVPVRVVTQQNAYDDPDRRLPAWQIWANRALVPMTQQFVAVSQATERYLRRVEWVPEGKIRRIPNAIAPLSTVKAEDVARLRRLWAADDGAGPLIGTVARFDPQKGLDVLLEAVARLRQHVPSLRCVFVGEGELRGQLEAQSRSLGVAHMVHFSGTRRDVPAVLAALDVFVLPSRFEGLSLALLEAMAAGRPVVATAVSGTVEVVRHEATGLLVPPNDPEALAAALRRLLAERALAERLARAGQEHVLTRYTIEPVARRYEAMYEELLAHV